MPISAAECSSGVRPGGKGFPAPEVYRAIKMAVFDVDGTLTDGTVSLDGEGVERKRFHLHDGTGITLLRQAGYLIGLLSGRVSPTTAQRARQLRIPPERIREGAQHKVPAHEELLRVCGVEDREVAYMGDDLIDLPIFERVALACCPGDARPEVPPACHVVAAQAGGRGAVRQLCEHLLKARADGTWERTLNRYLRRED